jgi:glycosyltransferase involved in cell wall biosynthesis
MISVIIPSYQSAAGLDRTLTFLAAQTEASAAASEIIVVDDGSTDETPDCVRRHQAQGLPVRYIHAARTAASCRARARNLGAAQARGALLTFVDAGIVMPPAFLRDTAKRLLGQTRTVCLHLTYGLFAEPTSPGAELLAELTPDNFAAVLTRLRLDPHWEDPRRAMLDQIDDQLDGLAAPWTLGWTCALTVSAALFQEVGGFDESFIEWGDEDTDLCYRLYAQGARFVAERQALCIHLPHPKVPFAVREAGRLARRRKVWRKRPAAAAELFVALRDIWSLEQTMRRSEDLILGYAGVRYPPELLQEVRQKVRAAPLLLVGADRGTTVEHLGATHVAAHSTRAQTLLGRECPQATVFHSFCIVTDFADRAFPAALITDYVRLLLPGMRREIFRELARIGERVYFLYTREQRDRGAEIYDQGHAPLEQVLTAAREAGLTLQLRSSLGRWDLYAS